MNKELEALKRLYEDAVVYGEYLYELDLLGDKSYLERIEKDFNLLKQALKRNEPLKVDLETKDALPNSGTYYDCPKCDKVIGKHYNYCPYCGQRLDWENK